MFERIVVPLDGSRVAESALAYLRPILHVRTSELDLVRVVHPTRESLGVRSVDRMEEEAEDYLNELSRKLGSEGVLSHIHVSRGHPARIIEALAAHVGATLIVMSSHGLTGLEHALFGSVTEDVLRLTHVPLIIFRTLFDGEVDPLEAARVTFRKILVPLDGGSASRSILPAARELATLFRARVLLLHVLRPHARGPLAETRRDALRDLEREADVFTRSGLETEILLPEGDPALEIQSAAWSEQADLVAMATHGRSQRSRFLVGSVTERILRSALVPVLTVRGGETPLLEEEGV
jgi:nucleotide-binding universal stress UspA family protein